MEVTVAVRQFRTVSDRLRHADFDKWEALHNDFVRRVFQMIDAFAQRYRVSIDFIIVTVSIHYHRLISSDPPPPEEMIRVESVLRGQGVDLPTLRDEINAAVASIAEETITSMEQTLHDASRTQETTRREGRLRLPGALPSREG